MSTKINVRSPYYVKVLDTNAPVIMEYCTLKLYIWTGLSTDTKVLRYTLTKNIISGNDYIVFELSELIKDFLVTEYGTYSTDVVWVYYEAQKFMSGGTLINTQVSSEMLALDGYGYFEDGTNPQLSQQLLQSNTILYYNEGQDIILPIWAEFLPEINVSSGGGANIDWNVVEDFWQLYDVSWGFDFLQIVDNGNTDQKIQYIRISSSEELADGDTITITSATGGTTVITLEEICEPKYTPLNIIFYNKFGALQNVWFFKKSMTTLNVRNETYKRSIMDFSSTPTYSEQIHQVRTFNANGKETLQANTGFIDEQYNEVIRQLLLSEQVWVDNGTDVLPIRPVTNSLQFKTSVNDKLINYTLDFEYAFDKINNIR